MKDTLRYEDIIVHPVPGGWVTLSLIVYKDLCIRSGYFTNGANIPRIMWRLMPPNDPVIFPGIVIHDYLCDRGEYCKADDYLEDILIALEDVQSWKRKLIMLGVRSHTKVSRPVLEKISSVWNNITG